MPDYEYDVYLSYPDDERNLAVELTAAFRERGCLAYSNLDILVGERPDVALRRALDASRFVVLLFSTSISSDSSRTRDETDRAMKRETAEGRVVVLPAITGPKEMPILLPPILRGKLYVDFRDPAKFGEGVDALLRVIQPTAAKRSSPASVTEDKPAPATPPPPVPDLPPLTVPDELVQACTAGECVLFAGAGLSARAGVPVWNQFLVDLLAHGARHGVIDADYEHSLRTALDAGSRDEAADGIVQAFQSSPDLLQSFMQEYFADVKPLAPAHRHLQQVPFAAVITPNYDRLLERALPEFKDDGLFTTFDAEALLDSLSQKRRFMLKLYGAIERSETLLFAPYQYREQIASNIPLARFMEGVFFSRAFLFIGLSLEGIQDFLSGFVFRGVSPRKHFALVAVEGSAWKAKAQLLERRYNIRVLPFPVSEGFPEVDTFLEDLSHAVRPIENAPIPAPTMAGLRGLLLEDIGTFERLEMQFPKGCNWKVLLGDNGVGKSTILKAIAVAIMGNDARSFAGRLVRTGRTRGRITLFTEHNPTSGYVTEILTKDMLAEAEVVSLPTRPMEAEGFLALGFSPLRVVSWSSSTGPQPVLEKGRPTADDLLPLVSGEADPRMDRLKQWIVNLDSADTPGRTLTLTGHTRAVRSIVFTPDGRTVWSGSIDGTIRSWDVVTGRENRVIHAHRGGVNSIALSDDGKVLASGSFDRLVKTWNAGDGTHIREFVASRTQIFSVALSPGGRDLIAASESGSIRIWSPEGTARRHIQTDSGGAVWCIAVSPDGERFASGTYAGVVNVYQMDSGRPTLPILVGRGPIMGIAWSPDGERLVTAPNNGPVHVWDAAKGTLIRELPGADTRCVAISRDGKIVAAGFENGDIRAWHLESGEQVMHLQAHPQAVWSLAFSPGGRTLASASEDASIRLWNLPSPLQGRNEQETIRRFFRLIGKLTDRPDIDYLKVTENFRVMIKTSDAPEGVPLELLSQGMTSLFGWIGVVCQRLKETLQIPTQDPLPTDSYALVLIDELDAHMHPRWQQVLVDRLKKMLPNVQFIASTHSPLIVGGLKKEEVDRFTIIDGKVVKVDFDADMTLGRTDQVLTGELFGLETTLDPATQKLIEEYRDLLGEPARTKEQQQKFLELGRKLEEVIPPSPSDLVERRASELLEALDHVPTDALKALDPEGKVRQRISQLSKAVGGRS